MTRLALCALGVTIDAAIGAALTSSANHDAFMTHFPAALFGFAALWYLTYVLARWKRRQPWRWLMWTAVTGWIPLAILIFVPRKAFMDGETALCPHCASEIPTSASVCKHCARATKETAVVSDGALLE